MLARDRGRFRDARRAAQRVPARRRGARRHLLPDRPARDGARRSASTGRPRTRSIRSPTATSRWRSLAAASICAVHLSRFAEELVVWTSAQFGFVRLSDGFTTGSSIMPQKRNPDAAELVRGQVRPRHRRAHRPADRDEGPAARLFEGHAGGQGGHLRRAPGALAVPRRHDRHGARPGAQRRRCCARAAGSGYATATDLADWLVRELGLPFREAHHVTGRLVGAASAKGVGLEELSLAEMQEAEPRITRGGLRGARRRELGGEPHQLRRHRARQRPRAGAGLARAAGLTEGLSGRASAVDRRGDAAPRVRRDRCREVGAAARPGAARRHDRGGGGSPASPGDRIRLPLAPASRSRISGERRGALTCTDPVPSPMPAAAGSRHEGCHQQAPDRAHRHPPCPQAASKLCVATLFRPARSASG